MLHRKVLAFFAFIALMLFFASAVLLLTQASKTLTPNISITLLSYQKSPWPELIEVHVAITNIGHAVIVPQDDFDPNATLRVELPTGWTNSDIGPVGRSSLFHFNPRLIPGKGMDALLLLPTGARRWQVGYQCKAPACKKQPGSSPVD